MMIGLGLSIPQVSVRQRHGVVGGDSTPPGTVSDFAQTFWDGVNELDLSFTVPGDNAFSAPVAAQYEIRYRAGAPMTDDTSWNLGTVAVGPWFSVATHQPGWTAGGPGTEVVFLPGIPGTTYYVAIRFQDAAGNMSGVSNNVSVTA